MTRRQARRHDETIENTVKRLRGGGETEANRQADEMSDESKHASSHFRPTPSCRFSLARRPQSVPPTPGRGMSGREDQLAETACGHIRQNERPNRPAPVPCLTPVRPGPIPIATQHEHEHEHDETEMTRALKCAVFVSSISPHAPRNETPMPTTTNEDERRRTGTRRSE